MAKLLYSFTMSLDGYIAGPDGDMSWLGEYLATPNPVAEKLVSDIGCLLVGANTNRGDDPNRGTDKEGASTAPGPARSTWSLTTRLSLSRRGASPV